MRDPFGHEWIISQEMEKISPEEMQRRWNAMVTKTKA
jgi:PhnB protein